jgi:ABC-type lipoprotein export system ATPase subunit
VTTFNVLNTENKGTHRRITVDNGKGGKLFLKVHQFAQIGKGDVIDIDPTHTSRISVVAAEDSHDLIRVTPHFEVTGSIRLGDQDIAVRLTEIVTAEDSEAYAFLEGFHYKTSASLAEREDSDEDGGSVGDVGLGGRRAVLVCYLKFGTRWSPAAYIELQMPLLMVKPRHEILDHPFRHPLRPISWETWDQHAIKQFVNCIVRIARVVTSPEYRGLGLARIVIDGAKSFAKERWHIRGRRPLFMEISAEMLKFLDFVSSSGLRFVGDTEGNLDRVHKDLISMLKNYKISSGIMSLQKKYLTKLQTACQELNRDFQATLDLLKDVVSNPARIAVLPADEYYLIKTVLRTPIPYFLGALDDASEDYLEKAMSGRAPTRKDPVTQFASAPGRITVRGLRLVSRYRLPQTPPVRAIMDSFGLKGEELVTRLLEGVDLEASGGNIIFVSGPSGSGKSVLLQALDPNNDSKSFETKFSGGSELNYSAGWIRHLPNDVPLIQYFAERWGIERAIAALNQAGLSEAFVYLKPYQLLSRGQRYRARLAELALRGDQVWLIDEFCADLDPLTARIVANNLRKHVVKYMRIAIVAAANYQHYLDALRPTRVLHLRHGAKPEMFSYREFMNEFHPKVA